MTRVLLLTLPLQTQQIPPVITVKSVTTINNIYRPNKLEFNTAASDSKPSASTAISSGRSPRGLVRTCLRARSAHDLVTRDSYGENGTEPRRFIGDNSLAQVSLDDSVPLSDNAVSQFYLCGSAVRFNPHRLHGSPRSPGTSVLPLSAD